MIAKGIRAIVLLGLVYRVVSGPAFEGNPFLQVLSTSTQKPNQADLYVVLPSSGQQLHQLPSTIQPPIVPNVNQVHSSDCVHSQQHLSTTHLQQASSLDSNESNTAQTVVHTNTPELNRRCLKSTGLFLGSSCDKFVSCLNGTATELSCPEGLLFNSEGLYCDRAENVQCNGKTSAAVSQHIDSQSGYLPAGSPIHASLVQFSVVPPQQVGQTGQQQLQHQQLQQQHLQQQVSQSPGNVFVQSVTVPTTSTQISLQGNYQQQQHQQHQQQSHQQQSHEYQQQQEHNQQQFHQQQHQQEHHQQQHQQHHQQQFHQHQHQQEHHQQQQQHHQQQFHQQQQQHQQQQFHQHQHNQQQSHQQQFHHQQNQQNQHENQQQNNQQQLHFSDIQHNQNQNQQLVSQGGTNGNAFAQAPISAQQNVLTGLDAGNLLPSIDTNEITGPSSDARCATLRGQFPSVACHTFLNCWGGVATEQACPDGLLFSTKGYCDYPENVNCAGRLLVAPQPVVAAPIEIKSPPPPTTSTSSFTPTTVPTLAAIPTTLSTPPLTAVVAPELKSKCLTARGQFPSTSCNKFVNCWDNIILEQECPEGFLFSTRGYCDFSQNVRCGDRPQETRGTTTGLQSECPLDNGTFRDRNKCSSYFTCTANKIVARYECPEGLNFNDYLGVCDFSYRVDCSKDPLLIPGRSNGNIIPQLRRGDECPADFATYRDAQNCGIYYTCVSKTIVATYECPAGFSFNDEIGICDYAERVDCSKSPRIFQVPKNVLPQVSNDVKQKIETCAPGTMFSLNPQCTAVCLCRSGVAEIVQCPAGLAYDSKLDKCILPHLARC